MNEEKNLKRSVRINYILGPDFENILLRITPVVTSLPCNLDPSIYSVKTHYGKL